MMEQGDARSLSPARRWGITIGVMVGMFLAALEATVVGTAMPTVIAALGGLQHYSWVFSAYLVTSTVSVPIWGKMSDLYGRRLLYQVSVAVFLLGSVLSGASQSMFQLILFRSIQGLGAGGLVPIAMTVIGDIYTLQERARMQAYFSGVWGLSSIVGPIVGGFLTDQLSWRWVFYINLPFGIASALILGSALKDPERHRRAAIDYAGAASLMAAVVLLMLAVVDTGNSTRLVTAGKLEMLGLAAVTFVLFALIERRAAEPVVPFRIFSNRVVSIAVVTGFLAGMAMFGAISFIPLLAQGARGATATQAGSLLTPLMLSWVSMSILGSRLLLRIGFRPTIVTGCALLTAGFALLAWLGIDASRFSLYFTLVVIGSGLGLTMLILLLAVQQAVPREELGTATSLNLFSRSIGGAVGVALMGGLLSVGLVSGLHDAAHAGIAGLTIQRADSLAANPNALVEQSAGASLTPQVMQVLRRSLFNALRNVFRLSVVISAITFLLVLRLPKTITRQQREH